MAEDFPVTDLDFEQFDLFGGEWRAEDLAARKSSVSPSLSDRRQRFLFEYLRTQNAAEAYRAVMDYEGKYSAELGRKLLARRDVRKALEYLRENCLAKDIITFNRMVFDLYENSRVAKKRGDGRTSNGSLELIGRMLGYFEKDNSQKSSAESKHLKDGLSAFYADRKPLEIE